MAPVTNLRSADQVAADAKRADIKRRIDRAELDFNRHRGRVQDAYKYAYPWRHKVGAQQPVDQLDEIFDSTAMNVTEDFAADMLNTFTPTKSPWLDVKPTKRLDQGDQRQIAGPLEAYASVIFAEMTRSNLYQALQEAYLDLAVGTMALDVIDIDPAQPIHCQAIPATELRIERGPYGFVDGRWRKWTVRGEDIAVLWPSANVTQFTSVELMADVEVYDGMWRDRTRKDAEVWHYVVMAGAKLIYEEDYTNSGSCPRIVARWSRDSTTAWGVGPLYRSLPDVKTINHVRYLSLKNYDKQVDPVTSYEDDGVVNLDQGIEPGKWVPRSPGSKAPEVIESRTHLDVEIFQTDELRSAIRRAHYQDRPDQLGKTPPTATQWADESAERQRRMGTPATNLVQELQYPLFRRFAYLLAQRGVLPKVELNGQAISLEPISPLLRAQEQEEVVRLDKFAEMIGVRFGPQMANIVIKTFEYAHRLAERLGVDPSLVRNESEIAAAIQQLGPVLGAAPGGGGQPQGAQPGA